MRLSSTAARDARHTNKDNDILPEVKADLAYFDPPYATKFAVVSYERFYHFVEGLMTYWEGLALNEDSKNKQYEGYKEAVIRTNAGEFVSAFLAGAKHIPRWLISYRDHAYPTEAEMKKISRAR